MVRFCRALAWLAALCMATLAHAAPNTLLTYDDARHLLARTGFGPSEAEVRAYEGLSRATAVRRLLDDTHTTAVTPLPESLAGTAPLVYPGQNATAEERMAFVREQTREGLLLRGWWMREMIATPSPLTERMTLFWHNHFVSAQPKVRITRLMATQNATLRANALGNFRTLLHAIARDPAMVIYLDNVQNRRGAPNENFAREVMELFTLGEGHYGEQDIKEAARAFTGWSVDRTRGTFLVRPFLHDNGSKTVFGTTGNLDGDQVLDLLLERPETATFIVSKMWRDLVSPDPDAAEIARIARRFRESDYDIKVALREILTSDAFYAQGHRGVLIKSPVEVVVGTVRALGLDPADALPFAVASAGMGQNLFSAPNVKGWPGGETWINASTLLARKAFLERITRDADAGTDMTMQAAVPQRVASNQDMRVPRNAVMSPNGVDEQKARAQRFARDMQRALANLHFDASAWMTAMSGSSTAERQRSAVRLLLATDPQQPHGAGEDAAAFVRGLLLDAAYQLK